LVLVTKSRRKCITGPLLDRLREILAQRCEDWGGELVEFGPVPISSMQEADAVGVRD
jgi:putative transposase